VVTSIADGTAEWVYDTLYCPRGQAENLIKLHKSQLASDRTSCRSALANQVRLVLHTAAYWLMLTIRDAIPKQQPLAHAEFTPLRLRLIKIAPASPRPPQESASPSPRPVLKPGCSAALRAACNLLAPEERGNAPERASSRKPQRPQPLP